MKVIKNVYSCLDEKHKTITFGEDKSNLAVRINDIEEEIKTAKKRSR